MVFLNHGSFSVKILVVGRDVNRIPTDPIGLAA